MRDLQRPGIKSGVPCIARQILNHWTTCEAPIITVKKKSHPIQAAFSWPKFPGKVRERGIQSPTEILHQCLPYLLLYLLEKEMATHSSVLAWRIPGMGEPGGLPSLGSQRVGHDWSDLAAAAALLYLVEIYTNLFISLQSVTVSTETEASLAEITEVYRIGVWGHITGHTHNNNSGRVGEHLPSLL